MMNVDRCRVCGDMSSRIVAGTGACRKCVDRAPRRAGAIKPEQCCACGIAIGRERALRTGRCVECTDRVGAVDDCA